MLSQRVELRSARLSMGALAVFLALVCGLAPASAAETNSSPEDRARFVSITRSIEEAPFKPSLKADREWALEWLTEAPDVSVTVCADPLGGLVQSNYPHASEIVVQYMFSMAASIIEHPGTTNDPYAQQLAGVEGALAAYQSILREKPEAKSPALDGLLQTRSRGELSDFVRKAFDSCSAKESETLSK
jgi:hypothetical protein